MGKTKRACVECGLLIYQGYQMGKHRRMCVYAKHNANAVEKDDEEENGAEEEDVAEEERDVCNVESNGSDEDVGDNVNAQRRPRAIMAFGEREVITFLRMVKAGEGMSVAQATDILQSGRSFNDERAQCLPKTLPTCWRIVDKVMFKDSILEHCWFRISVERGPGNRA